MLLYLDESGDTGLKIGSGSSTHFTLTAIRFADPEAAGACDEMVTTMCQDRKLKEGFVFHFTDTPHELRVDFLTCLSRCSFSVVAIVIDKSKIGGFGWKNKVVFYQQACVLLLEDMRNDLCESVLIFDRVGGTDIANKISKHLRQRFNDEVLTRIKRVEGGRSASQYRLLQAADMICGSIARRYRDDDDSYLRVIQNRVLSIKTWPD